MNCVKLFHCKVVFLATGNWLMLQRFDAQVQHRELFPAAQKKNSGVPAIKTECTNADQGFIAVKAATQASELTRH
jgi:hypothetical protein